MNGNTQKIKTFTDLNCWKESHNLVLMVYRATDTFPHKETFGLVSQMRRAVVSVASNIAEGFGRQGYKEKLQFYYLAQGSLTELKNQIIIAKDVSYINESNFQSFLEQADLSHKLLQGFITKTKTFLIHKS